nr:MAG TPA: hypothetical protein [Caudoviricetes sp.]
MWQNLSQKLCSGFTFCIIYYMIIKICGKNDVASTTY